MANYFHHLDPSMMTLNAETFNMSATFAVAGNETVYLQVKTGSKSCLIMDWAVASSAEPLRLTAIEAPTITDGTSALVAYNKNRQKSTTTATTLFYSDPTSVSAGTPIHLDLVTSGKAAGVVNTDTHWWLLKKSTSYVWKIEQLTNQATTIVASLTFAENFRSAP